MNGELARLAETYGWRLQDRATQGPDGAWVVAGAPVPEAFDTRGHAILSEVEERSLWFRSRNMFVEQLLREVGLPAALWDIGAGNGFVSAHLQQIGVEAVAVEPGLTGARTAAARGVTAVCGTIDSLGLPNGSIEAVGLFDVIEHLAGPKILLTEVRRVLRPGGLLIVTVPAYSWLWSEADELAGHERRYTRRQLEKELGDAGFRTQMLTYHFAAAVPPVVALRVLRRRRASTADKQWESVKRELGGQSRLTVALGDMAMAAERAWNRRFRVPFGTSVFAACRA